MGPYDYQMYGVSTLDLNQLVTAGVIPASSLRLVPQMAALQRLRVLKASGYPMQGKQAVAGVAATRLPTCACVLQLTGRPTLACLLLAARKACILHLCLDGWAHNTISVFSPSVLQHANSKTIVSVVLA